MSKRLPLVIVLLVAISLAFTALIVKELTVTPRRVARPRPQPAGSVGTAAPAATPAAPAPAAPPNYSVVATRNLFSPTRTEAPPPPPAAATAAPPAPVLPKPNLFGVVLQDSTPIAYLEDPVSKRVARYRVGDSVAGGTVQSIGPDTVMLARPEGPVTVRLHDPTRPKPAVPAAAPVPGAAGASTPTPAIAPAPIPGLPTGIQPGTPPQSGVPTPFRRPQGVTGRVPPQPANAPTPQ